MKLPTLVFNGRLGKRLTEIGLGRRLAAVAVGIAALAGYWSAFMAEHDRVFELQGAPEAELEALTKAPNGWSDAFWADMGFVLLAVWLVSLLVSASGNAPIERWRRGEPLDPDRDPMFPLRALIGVTTTTFAIADGAENLLMRHLFSAIDGGTITTVASWVFRAAGIAEVVKWGALAVTGILIVRLWTVSPPVAVADPPPVHHDDRRTAAVDEAASRLRRERSASEERSEYERRLAAERAVEPSTKRPAGVADDDTDGESFAAWRARAWRSVKGFWRRKPQRWLLLGLPAAPEATSDDAAGEGRKPDLAAPASTWKGRLTRADTWLRARPVIGHLWDAASRPFRAAASARRTWSAFWRALRSFGRNHRPDIRWGRPGSRPIVEPEAWDPHDKRLGIAVSGGGIRSASLAMGALQALRDRGVIDRTRYVASVSGGSYTTSAFTAINQYDDGEPPPRPAGFAPGTPEEQRLRRSLRYLLENSRTATSAVLRIVLGILINFAVLYAVLFAFLRPVGWAVTTPAAHDELRVSGAIAVDVEEADPLRCDDDGGCEVQGPEVAAGSDCCTGAGTRQIFTISIDDINVAITFRTSGGEEFDIELGITSAVDGRVTVADGTARVTRQPTAKLPEAFPEELLDSKPFGDDEDQPTFAQLLLGDTTTPWEGNEVAPSDVVRAVSPVVAVRSNAVGFGDSVTATELADFVTVERSPSFDPIGLLERRAELEIKEWHWKVALGFIVAAALLATYRTLVRPDNHSVFGGGGMIAGGLGVAWFLFFVAIPWLLVEIPARFVIADAGPSDDLLGSLDWLPGDPGGLPPLMAWLLLAGTAVSRFVGERKKKPADTTPKKRNTAALLGKLMKRVQQLAVALALVILVVGGALVVLAGAALNGPTGGHTFLAREVGLQNDVIVWAVVTMLLMALTTAGESYGWSPGPVYKRQLSVAFHQRRDGNTADRRSYRAGTWTQFAPAQPGTYEAGDERLGYLDGERGDGAELVLCTAANVRGFGTTPAGREAVSFTVSRSWTGGPELGWVDTSTYVDRMGRRRKWDVNLPGITALSGAAVSSSMGNKGFGPIGSFLALLNVRLGAWIPHPQHVNAMAADDAWHHNPGWPWYIREVVRRHKRDARYLYVSDGGHWENFAIVEALRRGCTTIICIAAAGDGVYSLNTFGEAAEIARTDLGVEITIDDIWKVRPKLGDAAETLPSGRQYILNPGPAAELGQAADVGYALGTFRYPDGTEGNLLLLDAAMIDKLPPDVHSYAENHPEFPDVSTGDQFFSDRDFESYRVLGRELVRSAFSTPQGEALMDRIQQCDRTVC